MVRFVRLTSWRSWDLLNVDSGILELPPPELNLTTDCQTPPLLSCPAQRGRILLVAMTSAQCVRDMQPLDTSSFKAELLSDADATPARHLDPSGGNGTLPRARGS
ncbi:hypothetical protein D4764_08G0011310 [Takifugu flavidus]|uniref:Uncharacterized protein n=1 Tax=Takifugu flavidus TaxID=433684 RepID=A0A5C6MPD5_9TELE|nr:hypothetical protein D4764_08G0011310 [Takifugu flavidus]